MTDSLARQLWQARNNGTAIHTTDFPQNESEAYAVQFSVDKLSECSIVGYKIGATVNETMALMGITEPFFGPLFNTFSKTNGATVEVFTDHAPKVETEFVVALSQDLDLQSTVSEAEVRAATDWISGGFEFIGSRFANTPAKKGYCAIADSGSNVDFVVGEPCTDWESLDLSSLPASLTINGQAIASGHSGMSIAGSPFGMVAWLANHPQMKNRGLGKGDMISCGTCTGMAPVKPGDTLLADFGVLGTLEAHIESA